MIDLWLVLAIIAFIFVVVVIQLRDTRRTVELMRMLDHD
jgi:hypothetical protein